MVVLRLLSLVLIVVALMLLGADAVSSLEAGGGIRLRSIEGVWALFDMGTVTSFKAWTETTLPQPLPAALFGLLAIPSWAALGALGVTAAVLFRQRAED